MSSAWLGVCERGVVPTWHNQTPNRSKSHKHLHRYDTGMDIRNSFSRLKKKVKRLGNKHKPDRTGSDIDGESVGAATPLPRPEPHIAMDDSEGNGTDTGGLEVCSTDQPRQPDEREPVPVSRSENDRGGEVDVDGGEISLVYSYPHPDVDVGAGSGPGRKGSGAEGEEDGQFYHRSSAPPTPHSREPDSA